jgi:hypothetical protein
MFDADHNIDIVAEWLCDCNRDNVDFTHLILHNDNQKIVL